MAKRIVEGYDFGRELTQEEKRALIQAILDNASLNKESTSRCYLSTLMKNLQQIGLKKEQQIYGTMINLGVNGAVIEEAGYGYDRLLKNQDNLCQRIMQHKDKIETRVGSMTILTALSKTIYGQEEQELQDKLERLGISRDFINKKDARNLYMAKRIVEGYEFGRKLSKKEKRAIIQAIVANSRLDNKKIYISTLMKRFEKMGLKEQEIYGTIINLGVNRAVLKVPRCGYAELLSNQNNACQTIANHIGEIRTGVTEETIEKALSKAEKIMKKVVKRQKDKGTISTQAATRAQLDSLVTGEISQEMHNAPIQR